MPSINAMPHPPPHSPNLVYYTKLFIRMAISSMPKLQQEVGMSSTTSLHATIILFTIILFDIILFE